MTSTQDPWNPQQYERFRDERLAPATELMALVHLGPIRQAVDLGCGTGEITALLHSRLNSAEVLGIDHSLAMLQRARDLQREGLRFETGDIADFAGSSQFDLVFSNAALHWCDDHPTLFQRLFQALRPGGQLAVQMPNNTDYPTHLVAEALARESPFREALPNGPRLSPVQAPRWYATTLYQLGFSRQTVFEKLYPHVLVDRDEVVEWVKGTTLTWYQERLGEHLYAEFLIRYRERLSEVLPDDRPFFFPFKRLLIWAEK